MESRLVRIGVALLCALVWLGFVLHAVGVYGQACDLGACNLSGLDLPVEKPGPKAPILAPGAPTPARPVPKAPEPEPVLPQEDEKPPTIYGSEVKSDNQTIIYVLDISGSMGLDLELSVDVDGVLVYGDRLVRAKNELAKSVSMLPPGWRFEVLAFDCDTLAWAGELREATEANKKLAINWALSCKAQGATGTASAVGRALLNYPACKLVILLTDGEPNCNALRWCGNVPPAEHRADIKWANHEKRAEPAIIDVFGISCPTGSEMHKFCTGVAGDNAGMYVGVR